MCSLSSFCENICTHAHKQTSAKTKAYTGILSYVHKNTLCPYGIKCIIFDEEARYLMCKYIQLDLMINLTTIVTEVFAKEPIV